MSDKTYLELVKKILDYGEFKGDRTGTGTYSIFGHQMRFDLSGEKIPLLTTKKMHYKSIIHELIWFLSGSTNIKYLQDNKVRIWNEWADGNGDLGPVYGKQWRNFGDNEFLPGKDQIKDVIESIKNNPNSRRHIVSAWNPNQIEDMALPPCHCLFQFFVNNGKLSCQLYQRSCDVGLGVPFNIAQYSMLVHMVAKVCDLEPHEFVWTGGDVHIYVNHVTALREQLEREPLSNPTLTLPKKDSIFNYEFSDFVIDNYKSHGKIKMEVSI